MCFLFFLGLGSLPDVAGKWLTGSLLVFLILKVSLLVDPQLIQSQFSKVHFT